MAKTELEDDGVAAEVIDTPAPEPMNYRDEVADDVRKTLAQLKAGAATTEEIPEDDGEAPVLDAKPEKTVARDDEGKFAKAPKEKVAKESTAAPETAAPDKSASPDIAAKASAPVASTPQDVAPPAGWTPDAKQAWAALKAAVPTLPPEVQASISAIQAAAVKREQDMSAGGQQWSNEKRQYESTLAPVSEAAKRYGITPSEGIQRLMAANDLLERDPATGIMELARSYGVNLATLVSNPPAPQPQRFVDPMVPQLNQKLSTLESQLNGFLQTQTLGVVDNFAKNAPHFDAVQSEITTLIPIIQQQNQGLSHAEVLQKAYDQAIWLNPEVRAAMVAEQAAKADKARQDQAAETERQRVAATQTKQAKSQKAAISIKGSSTGAPAVPKQAVNGSGGDIYDDVRAAIHQLRADA